jgi:hypothetical protein
VQLMRRFRTRICAPTLAMLVAAASSCDLTPGEVGEPCFTDDARDADEFVTREDGVTDALISIRFDCRESICMSIDGDEPFCSRICADNDPCPPMFRCSVEAIAIRGLTGASRLCVPVPG